MTEISQHIAATLHAWQVNLTRRLHDLPHDERGSVTIQEVMWAIAAIGFVGIVAAAISAFLNNKIGLIK